MKASINYSSSISHQTSFRKPNWTSELLELNSETSLITPIFKQFIPLSSLRRLSTILKTSITTAIDCNENTEGDFDAIIVGTALGCLTDTEKFLQNINNKTSEYISPTAFIQSTHNTISGQISLFLKNHSYNITHTQNHVSFELALIDAFLCLSEGKKAVLIGSVDEKIDFLEQFDDSIIPRTFPLTSITAFFSISPERNNPKDCCFVDVSIIYNNDVEASIHKFLEQNNITLNTIDLLLHSGISINSNDANFKSINYLKYSGINYSASAFASDIAVDYLTTHNLHYALIINTLCPNSMGLILLQKND